MRYDILVFYGFNSWRTEKVKWSEKRNEPNLSVLVKQIEHEKARNNKMKPT